MVYDIHHFGTKMPLSRSRPPHQNPTYGLAQSEANILSHISKLPTCLVGIEACATSHHWAREIAALGHTARHSPAPPAGSRQGRKTASRLRLTKLIQKEMRMGQSALDLPKSATDFPHMWLKIE